MSSATKERVDNVIQLEDARARRSDEIFETGDYAATYKPTATGTELIGDLVTANCLLATQLANLASRIQEAERRAAIAEYRLQKASDRIDELEECRANLTRALSRLLR